MYVPAVKIGTVPILPRGSVCPTNQHKKHASINKTLPDLARTLDAMPVTFAKMGLRPSFKLQYGPYVNC